MEGMYFSVVGKKTVGVRLDPVDAPPQLWRPPGPEGVVGADSDTMIS